MRCRSNSANPPSTVTITRPCGVVVSAHWSESDLKLAPALPMASNVLSKSLVERVLLMRSMVLSADKGTEASLIDVKNT